MELILLYIMSILVSYGIVFKTALFIVKDVADSGYKFEISRVNEIADELSTVSQSQNLKLNMLIPGYNIFSAYKAFTNYKFSRSDIIDQLSVLGVLDEMTEKEIEEYKKDPTALNAMKIIIGKQNSLSVSYETDEGKGEIFFDFNEETEEITIVDAIGVAEDLSIEEQKEKVKELSKVVMLSYKKDEMLDKIDRLGKNENSNKKLVDNNEKTSNSINNVSDEKTAEFLEEIVTKPIIYDVQEQINYVDDNQALENKNSPNKNLNKKK